MSTQSIYTEISTLLIAQAGFKEQENYVAKDVDVNGEEETLIFRQKDDQLILMNLTRNEVLTSKNPKESGVNEELFKEQFYQELRTQLGSNSALDHLSVKEANKGVSLVDIYDKATGNNSKQDSTTKKVLREALTFTKFDGMKAGAYVFADQAMTGGSATVVKTAVKTVEVVQIAGVVGKALVSKAIESTTGDLKKLTDEIRKNLKLENKIGVDFARTSNGLSLARGDYIILTKIYKQKEGFFSTLELPKGTELKVTGHTLKKGETYATCSIGNKAVDVKVKELQAEYGNQYLNQYKNRPDLRNQIDKRMIENAPKTITTDEIKKSMQMHREQKKDKSLDKGYSLDL